MLSYKDETVIDILNTFKLEHLTLKLFRTATTAAILSKQIKLKSLALCESG